MMQKINFYLKTGVWTKDYWVLRKSELGKEGGISQH